VADGAVLGKAHEGAVATRGECASAGAVDELWRRFKRQRCPGAREQLILHFAPLVTFVAARVGASVPASVERADLVSDGVIGLIDAVERFDLSRGVKFETYAIARIRGAILDELRALDWVPRSVRAKARRLELANSKLRGELLRDPTPNELAAELGCDAKDVHSTRPKSVGALEEVIALGGGEDSDHVTVLDTVIDETVEEPGAGVEAAETADALFAAIRKLGEREFTVISLYYFQGLTLARIGEVFGVTESRISQIHGKALRTLGLDERLRACAEGPDRSEVAEDEVVSMYRGSQAVRATHRVDPRVPQLPVRRSA
jgi:RNA polymerase sigma factor for flagellar operon FliA